SAKYSPFGITTPSGPTNASMVSNMGLRDDTPGPPLGRWYGAAPLPRGAAPPSSRLGGLDLLDEPCRVHDLGAVAPPGEEPALAGRPARAAHEVRHDLDLRADPVHDHV